jgi:hypothetical protein
MDAERPLGFNPVGEHAPGLPQHDKPLPGHVSGAQTLIGGDDAGSDGGVASYKTGDPGLPLGFGVWSGRVILVVVTYLTLPIQLGLYPIAGVLAFIAGYIVFHANLATGVGFDSSMGSAWGAAWLVLLAATRLDTGLEERNPGYRNIRHIIRLASIALWMVYFDITEQGDSLAMALFIGLASAAIGHFILRSKWLLWIWGNLQFSCWLRTKRPPLPV